MTTINAARSVSATAAQAQLPSPAIESDRDQSKTEFREKFNAYLGQTMYGTMLKSLRKSTSKTPYFNGGRTEEVFGAQLDQVIAEKMGRRDAQKLGGLSNLSNLPRR